MTWLEIFAGIATALYALPCLVAAGVLLLFGAGFVLLKFLDWRESRARRRGAR